MLKAEAWETMKKHPHFITVLAILAAGPAQAANPPLAVTGLVSTPLHLTAADLSAFPPIHILASQISGKGPVALDCNGASLAAILSKATLKLGGKQNAGLSHTLLVTGDDGYTVVLSLGEIDADYGDAGAIIATSCNGKPLNNPRLVMPNDKHGGRAVQGVVSIEVK